MNDIRLAMYVGSGAEIISLGDYLALRPNERARLTVSPSWSTVSLMVDGTDRWGDRLSLGALGVLVAQLPQAAARIDSGERAVVRSGVFDVPEALFLVFEPSAGRNDRDETVATLAVTGELSDPMWTPNGPRADALYSFIDQRHDEMVTAGTANDIGPHSLPRSVASAALRREFELGTEVVQLLGEGSS